MVDSSHPELSFALDIADKAIKLLAVLLGGVWTYWNYKKSRTYEQKMELSLSSSTFQRGELYVEVVSRLKNLGATKHSVQQQGTSCEIIAVFEDLTEQSVRVVPVFTRDEFIEPGETISDTLLSVLALDISEVVWLRVELRVASGRVEWQQDDLIRLPLPTEPAIESASQGE